MGYFCGFVGGFVFCWDFLFFTIYIAGVICLCFLGSFFRVGGACVRSVGGFPIVVFFRFRGFLWFFGLFLVVGRCRRFW